MKWFWQTWVPIAIAVTGISMLVFLVVQQQYRQTLNDPQQQIAEDTAQALAHGVKPSAIVAPGSRFTDIATSLRPYIVIYDKDAQPIVWSGTYRDAPPQPPRGVFTGAKENRSGPGESKISWQPESGVRSAIVVVHVPSMDGYVLVGRNMQETESRIEYIMQLIGAAWMCMLLATLIAAWFGARLSQKKHVA